MNEKIIENSVKTITIGVVIIAIASFCYLYLAKTNISKNGNYETRDRFTVCIQTVMSESRQSGKPIDANSAKDICLHVDKA